MRATAVAQWTTGGARVAVEQLELAVEAGSHRGAYTLALLLLNGLGGIPAGRSAAGAFVRYEIFRSITFDPAPKRETPLTIFCAYC